MDAVTWRDTPIGFDRNGPIAMSRCARSDPIALCKPATSQVNLDQPLVFDPAKQRCFSTGQWGISMALMVAVAVMAVVVITSILVVRVLR